MTSLSKTQIDQLGDRLRRGSVSDNDLRALDTFRRSFSRAHDRVVTAIRAQLSLQPTGRPAKSTTSITEKLRRETIRLSQMQDIAGCRLVVPDIAAQEAAVTKLSGIFPSCTVVDRRERPSHGYRAIHVLVEVDGQTVEVQVRTALQHLWAELSEKLSDVLDPAIKYGGGDPESLSLLGSLTDVIAETEREEREHAAGGSQEEFISTKKRMLAGALQRIIVGWEQVRRTRGGFPD